jgi:hypothetical protein
VGFGVSFRFAQHSAQLQRMTFFPSADVSRVTRQPCLEPISV